MWHSQTKTDLIAIQAIVDTGLHFVIRLVRHGVSPLVPTGPSSNGSNYSGRFEAIVQTEGSSMSERRFALVDFTHKNRAGLLLYEAGHTYALSRAIAHAATKRELVAKQKPPGWTSPGMFRSQELLTEVEVTEAEAELKALQRHALEVVHPEAKS
jgi:hypothetical protein